MRLTLAFVAMLACAKAAVHINQTAEGASMYGEILVGEDGHMYVKDQYIVVFKRDAAKELRDAHLNELTEEMILRQYNGKQFFGYAATLTPELKAKVEASPEVAYVEKNGIAWALGEEEAPRDCAPEIPMTPGVWGTIRTNNLELIITGNYFEEEGAGQDVHSYVIDTGIDTTHSAFQGRADFGRDFTGEGPGDRNGHGTHVAGTMIGSGFGIAQEGRTTDVKVLNGAGSGTFANVIAGILWCPEDAARDRSGKGVSNLSLGGGYNQAVVDAIEDSFEQGVIPVVAAGNSNSDACNASPAAAPDSICVGSSDNQDRRSSFSSFGCCVDLFAPGTSILSTLPGERTAVYSGTSMAAPHVAGVVQLYWSTHPNEETANIKADILAETNNDRLTNGVFSGTCGTAPRCIAQDHCNSGQTNWFNNQLAYSRCVT